MVLANVPHRSDSKGGKLINRRQAMNRGAAFSFGIIASLLPPWRRAGLVQVGRAIRCRWLAEACTFKKKKKKCNIVTVQLQYGSVVL